MTRKERLEKTLRGEAVDRPPVNFYEINAYHQNAYDPDPYNIFNDPSWKSLLELTAQRSDRIVLNGVRFATEHSDLFKTSSYTDSQGRIFCTNEIHTPKGVLTQRTRRDKDVNTVWELEHFLKTEEDVHAYLSLPDSVGVMDTCEIFKCDEVMGDSGLSAIDFGDALCAAASLFSMEDYMVFALTEQKLFHKLVEKIHHTLVKRLEMITTALPGRFYRVVGSEYASEPYLPPELYRQYIFNYDKELISLIKKSGGFARVHSHGNLRNIIDQIVEMGADGIDPIEPPNQGDVTLRFMRENYGKDLVLFGNIEIVELETMGAGAFRERVKSALDEGMCGSGRGFVLMPSACPLKRKLSDTARTNYETMIELAESAKYK